MKTFFNQIFLRLLQNQNEIIGSLNKVKFMLQGIVGLDGGANLGGGLEYGSQGLDRGMTGVGAGVAEGLDLMGVVNMPGGVSVSPLSLGGANDGENSITGFGGMEGGLPGMGGIMGGACASAGMGDGMVMGGSGISASTGKLREDVMRVRSLDDLYAMACSKNNFAVLLVRKFLSGGKLGRLALDRVVLEKVKIAFFQYYPSDNIDHDWKQCITTITTYLRSKGCRKNL